MQKANQAYVQTQFTTVSQGELLLLLYDGALKFLGQAKEKIQVKDYVAKGNLISRALDIINELDGSLNEKEGGDLARNLHQLYFMCSANLLQANLRMDVKLIDMVITVLTGLRSAYAQIIANPDAKAAAAQIASRQSAAATTMQRAVPLPQQTAFTPGVARAQVTAAYGQKAVPIPTAGSPLVEASPLTPSAPQAAASLSTASAAPAQAPAAKPVPPTPATKQTTTQAQAPAPAAAPATQTTAQPSEQTASSAPLGLLNRRLAASNRYGKMSGM